MSQQEKVILPLEETFLKSIGIKPTMRALDLACGVGQTTLALARYLTQGSVLGVDQSEEMIRRAQLSSDPSLSPRITFEVGQAECLAFESQSFDFVYARLLFQHLAQPLQVLAEIKRILKPGGVVCLVDVDHRWASLYPEPILFSEFFRAVGDRAAVFGG
ncbi:MAG: class I SAM-dependent methyltransferase [Acaryochloridaceae cyanobacterium RL_2_7]|nr:class I SAM-dependent methyltransferase [Acaryochloridaceae cyanobacterium RL_2_7]